MEDEIQEVTEVTENVEGQATEELVEGAIATKEIEEVETQSNEKLYTEEEVNKRVDDLLAKKIARKEAKIRKEYEGKYSKLESVVTAGMKTNDINEATETLANFYKEQGIEIPQPKYNKYEEVILGKAEANSVIEAGFDEVVEETDRLAKKDIQNMTEREKAMFMNLAEYRQEKEREMELEKIGAKDIANSNDFKKFANKFDKKVPISEIYEMFEKMQTKKEFKPMGSMKTNEGKNEIKDFYTYEEASKFTREDYNKNPKLFEAVEKSMPKWYKK